MRSRGVEGCNGGNRHEDAHACRYQGFADAAHGVDARHGEDFKVMRENDMGERMIASPVPIAGRLLLRGDKALYCIARPGAAASK